MHALLYNRHCVAQLQKSGSLATKILAARTLADFPSSPPSNNDVGPWKVKTRRDGNMEQSPSPRPFDQELSLWRGGTSKGLFVLDPLLQSAVFGRGTRTLDRDWLANTPDIVSHHIASLLGSPDPHGRQLNGLGGGISSLSKAVILQRPKLKDRAASSIHSPHVAYTFIQVGVEDGVLDMSGNCGNLTSAVGPCAIDAGQLLHQLQDRENDSILDFGRAYKISEQGKPTCCAVPATVNLLNHNTGKVIRSTFVVSRPYESDAKWKFEPRGQFSMPGVPGTGSEIKLQFLNPGGSKTADKLPTGNPVDTIHVGAQDYAVSLVDISNPGIFIDGRVLGWDTSRKPAELDSQTILIQTLEQIRRKGAEMMGLDPEKPSIPKIVLVFPSNSNSKHLDCQALSMGKAHKAVPGTLALNLGAACQIPGTVPHQLARPSTDGLVTIGHPTGTVAIGAKVTGGHVEYVEVSRTARCLMRGIAFPAPSNYRCSKMTTPEQIAASKR